MKRLLFVAAIAMIVAPALASPELLPIKGTHYATYKASTGQLTPSPGPVRYGPVVWSSTYDTGYYFGSYQYGTIVLDWGDCGTPADPKIINGFQFGFATEMLLPDRLDFIIWYYGEENGVNSYNHVPLAGYIITDLPTGGPNWNGWTVTVDLEGGFEFLLEGSNLDTDGLVDFGYTYWFIGPPVGDATGPHISGCYDPNCLVDAPGMEDLFDTYFLDMNDPNQGLPAAYESTWWFNGVIFAQFYMEMYEGSNMPNMPEGCPNPGDSGWYCTADIEYTNECVVDLLDLAALLSNYGLTTGATHEQGDVEPEDGNGVWDETDGDGDVDLADLARLLSQYGDDCR
jgi:hypothetical protein